MIKNWWKNPLVIENESLYYVVLAVLCTPLHSFADFTLQKQLRYLAVFCVKNNFADRVWNWQQPLYCYLWIPGDPQVLNMRAFCQLPVLGWLDNYPSFTITSLAEWNRSSGNELFAQIMKVWFADGAKTAKTRKIPQKLSGRIQTSAGRTARLPGAHIRPWAYNSHPCFIVCVFKYTKTVWYTTTAKGQGHVLI